MVISMDVKKKSSGNKKIKIYCGDKIKIITIIIIIMMKIVIEVKVKKIIIIIMY